jgi:hypothetical protein
MLKIGDGGAMKVPRGKTVKRGGLLPRENLMSTGKIAMPLSDI